MNVEVIASLSSVVFGIHHHWRDQISGVYVSPGSAETSTRRGRIINDHSIVYSLSKMSAKITKMVDVH